MSGLSTLATNPTEPNTQLVAGQKTKPLGLIRRLSRERKGSVAIEFAIMAIPFLSLIFAIIESSLSFTTQQLMANTTDRISRDIRTGRLKATDLTGNQLRDRVCSGIALMAPAGCPDLLVDLKTYASFAAVPKLVPMTAAGDINSAGFAVTPGGPSTINHMRIFYRWPIWTDFMRASMSTMPGGKTLLLSSATWRNEPFDL